MSKQIRTILLTIAATILVVVLLQNARSIPLHFLIWEGTVPLVILFPLVFLLGVGFGYFLRRR